MLRLCTLHRDSDYLSASECRRRRVDAWCQRVDLIYIFVAGATVSHSECNYHGQWRGRAASAAGRTWVDPALNRVEDGIVPTARPQHGKP